LGVPAVELLAVGLEPAEECGAVQQQLEPWNSVRPERVSHALAEPGLVSASAEVPARIGACAGGIETTLPEAVMCGWSRCCRYLAGPFLVLPNGSRKDREVDVRGHFICATPGRFLDVDYSPVTIIIAGTPCVIGSRETLQPKGWPNVCFQQTPKSITVIHGQIVSHFWREYPD
jgi:hypothetical protein